ncbi:hypothetical protein BC835DRAFT_1411911 [Cytidiella melzeri]|nr:hypothetical protein BC835DRAFT_1411911 [Cytidiella melzeri]
MQSGKGAKDGPSGIHPTGDLEKYGQVQNRTRSRWSPYRVILGLALAYYGLFNLTKTHFTEHDTSRQWALRAFSNQNAISGDEAEKLYLSVPNEDSALAASRAYATHPHIASSKEDFEDSKVILKLFQNELNISAPADEPIFSAGSEASRNATLNIASLKQPVAWIDTYYPVMNTPLDRSLQILGDDGESVWDADLVEDGDPLDPDAAKYRDAVPTFHGLSKNGTAEGQLIYANYGTKEDYDELEAKGANFTGKIVLTRYFGIFRGLKIKGAQERGAVGVLIYSDPRDDGVVTVENGYAPYPLGPARNPTSVQRGSVQFISSYPGDPTTPGYPAYENATRTEGENIPKIPSLPISWANAQVLLKELSSATDARVLNGQTSARKVKLVNHVDDKIMPIYNTIAVIPGHIKDETAFAAWVLGAADPTSGTVSLHEVIRGFGALVKQGWKPLRNVLIASWDAEEYGLVGSTEWAEDFSDWISNNVVAYLNTDVSSAGSTWHSSASPSLANLIKQVALELPHPTDVGRTLWDAKNDVGPFRVGKGDEAVMQAFENQQTERQISSTGIGALGSGSDYTAFLQRLGIASMDQGFGGTPFDAVYHYHSVYDTQRWQELYADPGFYRHVAVAKHLGLVALRLTDAIILPLNTTQYALELNDYLDKIEKLAVTQSMDSSINFHHLRHAIHKLQAASIELDGEKTAAEKDFKDKLSKLPGPSRSHNRVLRWLKKLLYHILRKPDPVKEFIKAAKRVQKSNAKLVGFEKGFLDEDGIKDREWYRHLGVAPGKWLGYGATTLPSIYDALVYDKNATFAEEQVKRVAHVIEKLAVKITP